MRATGYLKDTVCRLGFGMTDVVTHRAERLTTVMFESCKVESPSEARLRSQATLLSF